jgi:hypothetical protein
MDYQKKLDFVVRMTKHGLDSIQHFDDGGTVLQGPVQAGQGNAVNPNSQGIGGFLGNIVGNNNQFQASSANVTPGTNTAQLNSAYQGVQGALGRTNNLVTDTYGGLQQGLGTQGFLNNQLTAQTLGGGPNLGQALLNQNTGQNIEQAAALAAGTRGAGTNAGLIASNSARQAANTQQNAINQASVLRQQQQLTAQQQLANLAGSQVNQGGTAIGLQNQAQLGEQGILQGANTALNNANVTQQSNINNVNADVASGNANRATQNAKGLGNSLSKGIGKAIPILGGFLAEGGVVPDHLHKMASMYAHGGRTYGMKSGGQVPGTPKVNHDDYSNDTVDAKLTPGEVVIDLDTLNDKGEMGRMARMLAQHIEHKKMGKRK